MQSHVVDILGSTRGRDQPIMLMEKAADLAALLPQSNYLGSDTVFFDPFCKAGEVLLATAFNMCLIKAGTQVLSDSNDVIREVYSGRFFGMAPDERHFYLTKRTFLGNDRSHEISQDNYFRNGSYLSEEDGRLNKEKFNQELKNMIEYIKTKTKAKKIVAIGNPPYQEADGGGNGSSAMPIYNYFAESLMDCDSISEMVLVIPARWFTGGKGLDKFRNRIITCNQIPSIHYFSNSTEVFPSVAIAGGICFLHYQKDYSGQPKFVHNKETTELDLTKYDVIPEDPKAFSIINKIRAKWSGKWVSEVARSRNHFGVFSDVCKKPDSKASKSQVIECYVRGRKIKIIDKTLVVRNLEDANKWKVAIPKAYGGNNYDRKVTLPEHQIFLIEPNVICSETYSLIELFNKKGEAQTFESYLRTSFVRYLVGLRKNTQNISRETWAWVPLIQDGKLIDDESLFKFFGLNQQERSHILKMAKEWS